jgi:GT2 family glycosyltransferase
MNAIDLSRDIRSPQSEPSLRDDARTPSPDISVVVLTYNRVDEVVRTLGRLLALPEQPRIIVADNGSTDGTYARLREQFPSIEVVRCARNRGAAARNAAVARLSTRYVAFCDDDTWWEAGSLKEAVRVLDRWPRAAVLNARVIVADTGETDATCQRMQTSPLRDEGAPGPALVGFMAGAAIFRTDVFRAMGGYDAKLFIGGEEQRVALDVLAAGHAIAYCPQLRLYHAPSRARDSHLRRRLLARNAAWVAWLRLPWRDAWLATLRAVMQLAREGTLWLDAPALFAAWWWIAPRRRVVPARVVAMLRQVQAAERAANGGTHHPSAAQATQATDARTGSRS